MINFYKCNHCGNLIIFMESSGVIPVCCGETMHRLEASHTDGAGEKHLPVIIVNGDRVVVSVGDVPHPMTAEHYIEWIVLETNKGIHVTYLNSADGKAEVGFTLQKGESVVAAYEHCNLHGLWAKEM